MGFFLGVIWCVFDKYFLRPIGGKYRSPTAPLVQFFFQRKGFYHIICCTGKLESSERVLRWALSPCRFLQVYAKRSFAPGYHYVE